MSHLHATALGVLKVVISYFSSQVLMHTVLLDIISNTSALFESKYSNNDMYSLVTNCTLTQVQIIIYCQCHPKSYPKPHQGEGALVSILINPPHLQRRREALNLA